MHLHACEFSEEAIRRQLYLAGKLFFLGVAKDRTREAVRQVVEALGGSVTSEVDERLFMAVTDLSEDAQAGCWLLDSTDREAVADVIHRWHKLHVGTSEANRDHVPRKAEEVITRSEKISTLPPSRGRDMLSAARQKQVHGKQTFPSSLQPAPLQVTSTAAGIQSAAEWDARPTAWDDGFSRQISPNLGLQQGSERELFQLFGDVSRAEVTATPDAIRVMHSDPLTTEERRAVCEVSDGISQKLSRALHFGAPVTSAGAFLQEHGEVFQRLMALARSQGALVARLTAQAQKDNQEIAIRVEDFERRFRPLHKRFKHLQHAIARRSPARTDAARCGLSKGSRCSATREGLSLRKVFADDRTSTRPRSSLSQDATQSSRMSRWEHGAGLSFQANTTKVKVLGDRGNIRGHASAGRCRPAHTEGNGQNTEETGQVGYTSKWNKFTGITRHQKENEPNRKNRGHKKQTNKKRRRHQVQKPSYCEYCRQKYVSLREHLLTPSHIKFAEDFGNYEELDTFLDTQPAVQDVLSKYLGEFYVSDNLCDKNEPWKSDERNEGKGRETQDKDIKDIRQTMESNRRRASVEFTLKDTTACQEGATLADKGVGWSTENESASSSKFSSHVSYSEDSDAVDGERSCSAEQRSIQFTTWTSHIKASPTNHANGQGEFVTRSIKLVFRRKTPPVAHSRTQLVTDTAVMTRSTRHAPRGAELSGNTSERINPPMRLVSRASRGEVTPSCAGINYTHSGVPSDGKPRLATLLSNAESGRSSTQEKLINAASCFPWADMSRATSRQSNHLQYDGSSSGAKSPFELHPGSFLDAGERNLRHQHTDLRDAAARNLLPHNGPARERAGSNLISGSKVVPETNDVSVECLSLDSARVASPQRESDNETFPADWSSRISPIHPICIDGNGKTVDSLLYSFTTFSVSCSSENERAALGRARVLAPTSVGGISGDVCSAYSASPKLLRKVQVNLLEKQERCVKPSAEETRNKLSTCSRGPSLKRQGEAVLGTCRFMPSGEQKQTELAKHEDSLSGKKASQGLKESRMQVDYSSGKARPRKVLSGLEMKLLLDSVKEEQLRFFDELTQL